ncbi:Protein CSF [Salix suchowensis]|nr:Protein CSF [Salix suchowensis]
MEADQGTLMNSISIVLDTEFSGGIHFSRLQDVLCFKAVWLDRIPILKSESVAATKAPPKQVGSTQDFTTAVLLRIRHIVLDVDLGHSISAITLDLTDSCLRTKFTESHHEVAISVSNFALVAKGNISGTASVPRCVFQTIRRRMKPGTHNAENNRMLELRMTSGSLVASLESEHQRLLHYRRLVNGACRPQAQDRPLLLSFTVNSAEIIAATTVGAIPKLISYANKFRANLQAQQDGASRESKTFRTTRTPKLDNALSAVANAMLSSARERFKEETGLSYIIKQHMSLRLGFLRLVVFPRTMRDLELASFVAHDVHARDHPRDEEPSPLLLLYDHLEIQSTQYERFDRRITVGFKQWLDALLKSANEATIVGLPSMTMHMISEEKVPEDSSSTVRKVIAYDFDSKFVRRTGVKDMEDIFITLNVALYSWLTLLRKNFTREMDQVQAASDWRTTTPINSPPVISGRRKSPDSLSLLDSPRSATSPRSMQPPVSATLMSAARRLTDADGQRAATLDMFPTSPQTAGGSMTPGAIPFPQSAGAAPSADVPSSAPLKLSSSLVYQARTRSIQRLTMRQLGEATPDVMHPFFMKKAGFNLEDALPQYVNEYATAPLEEIMEVLLKVYSRQLLVEHTS